MSDCPANTTVNTVSQYNSYVGADWVQGVINRIKAYWTKYNNASMHADKKISYVYGSNYGESTTDKQYAVVLKSLLDSIRTTLDNYKDTYLGTGGNFSWTSVTQYDSKLAYGVANEVRTNLLSLEAQCWACHTGDTAPTCTHCHTSADSCTTGDNCTCYNSCYTETCTCNNTTYGWRCGCYNTGHNAGVYTYTAFCGCNNTCYSITCTCNGICHCQAELCTTCDAATCHGHSCSCNTTCYSYAINCVLCHGSTY